MSSNPELIEKSSSSAFGSKDFVELWEAHWIIRKGEASSDLIAFTGQLFLSCFSISSPPTHTFILSELLSVAVCYGLSAVRTELKILWSGRPETERDCENSDDVDRAGAGGSTLIYSLIYIENQIDNETDIFFYITKHEPVKLLKCI